MKQLRVTARVDPDEAPAFFNLLANSAHIEEARVLEVNTTLDGEETFLFAIDGDTSRFEEEAVETPGVNAVELTETDDGQSYALLVMRPLETPLFEAIHRAGPHVGFVLRTPMIYRDGRMHGRVVGDTDRLQESLDNAPDALDVQIEEIGQYRGRRRHPERLLSDRQQEALVAALENGYYEQPREATQRDVADELGCTPQTAGTHIQKAEAKLVRAALDDLGTDL